MIIRIKKIKVHHENQVNHGLDNVLAELEAATRNPEEALRYE